MFLMAPILFGLAAVSIPVLIHLLHRQRTTPIKWGAMQFLLESPLQLKRRKRVDHWLLLLLRMAAVALIVLALARPLMVEGKYNPLGDGLATDIAVVVDRSLSTGRRAGDKTVYEQSTAAVGELVKTMRPSDTLSVVLAEHRPQVQSIRLAPANASDVPRKLSELKPGMSDASIPDAIRTAREVIGEGKNVRKMILVLSDEQRTGWSVDDDAAWRMAVGSRGAAAKVYSLPIQPDGKASDVAVADVSIAPSILGPNRPAEITASVTNSGPEPVSDLNVQLLVDGKVLDARPVPSLPPGESRTLSFSHTFTEAGSHWVKVQADVTDALEADNSAVIAANVVPRIQVLIIDGQLTSAGDFASSRFLRAAFQPVDEAREATSLVQPKVVSVSECASEKLEDYAAVIVNDVLRLPAEVLARLTENVRNGHSAWFILGPRTEPAFVKADLRESGLLAIQMNDAHKPGAASTPIEVVDAQNPMVRLITAAEKNALAGAVTRGWWPVTPQGGGDVNVVLKTQTGDPLVIERGVGTQGGRVVAWASGVDGGAWNNWPLQPQFVPLVNETLYHLVSGQNRGLENRMIQAGRDIVWTGPADPRVAKATLTRPDATNVNLTPRHVNTRQSLSYNDTFLPGLYQLRFDQTAVAQPIYFGVGIDPRELAPLTLSPGDVRKLTDRGFLEKRLKDRTEIAAAVGAVNKGRDLWPWVAVVLLATLVFETFMTWRVMRHQVAVQTA
jgi:hypothetical protein